MFDAAYSEYKLFQDIINAKSSFVGRLRDNASWDTLLERPITDDDRKAGVQRDMVVRLGCKGKQDDLSSNLRVVEVFHRGDS